MLIAVNGYPKSEIAHDENSDAFTQACGRLSFVVGSRYREARAAVHKSCIATLSAYTVGSPAPKRNSSIFAGGEW